MLSKTSEFTEFNGNFEILNISLGVPDICGQKRPVFRPREFEAITFDATFRR